MPTLVVGMLRFGGLLMPTTSARMASGLSWGCCILAIFSCPRQAWAWHRKVVQFCVESFRGAASGVVCKMRSPSKILVK